ncbi:MAG: site-specific DNA-methyltransferase [Anaerolineae bacterium]|nr:site-specific DNA-methyltransferase [Anaerolineae bacterium]
MSQLPLPNFIEVAQTLERDDLVRIYSSDGLTPINERVDLELKYTDLLITTAEFNRKLVSYQGNKRVTFHSWLKYKEGFSAELVENLLDKFRVASGQTILDPFAGSGTTLLVAQGRGVNAVGIDVLPICHVVWNAKAQYRQFDVQTLHNIKEWVSSNSPKGGSSFPHIPITASAFSEEHERKLMGYKEYVDGLDLDAATRNLLQLVFMSILEDISFTRKDGQYLRWDTRSKKAQHRDRRRVEKGMNPYRKFTKSLILDVESALVDALDRIIRDIEQVKDAPVLDSKQQLIAGTVLEILPKQPSEQFDAVITSPPYCNRYDYTRTYALELAFLGLSHEDIVRLRQEQLSCTVENRSKLDQLNAFYSEIGREGDFSEITHVIDQNKALQEVFSVIESRAERGDLNNKGVVQMVRGYFTELAFVIYELFRTAKPGASIAIVNDNVRYGGEIIPVDLIMTDLASAFGFNPIIIYSLQQRKGNSSQQMGKYGREALRKSITIWKKPDSNPEHSMEAN